ncbi:MAG: hypothetical protein LBD58_10660 [Treponema sp.]|nr:hypothetical protein [Treponema sp.]
MIKKLGYTAGVLAATILFMTACQNPMIEEIIDPSINYMLRIFPTPEHGTLALSHSFAPSGTRVTVYVNPDPGYRLAEGVAAEKKGVVIQGENGGNPSNVTKYGGNYQFSCPASNASITATFEPAPDGIYTVSIDKSIVHGVIAADPMYATPGDTIRLTLLPDSGYDLEENSLMLEDGTPVSETLPFFFEMPASHVTVKGRFEKKDFDALITSARKYLAAGQYDSAASFYEEAYQKNKDDPEAILYSTLAKLGSMLIDPYVGSILSGSLHFASVPDTLDAWICDEEFWEENDPNLWYATYAATEYTPDDAVLPKIYSRFSGFITPFGDFQIAQAPNTREKFINLIFWGLISSHTDGFNELLERINRHVFGENFEAIARRAETLSKDTRVPLNDRLKKRFKLEALYGDNGEPVYIGKAELDYIIANLRALKAAFEYLAAYDWSIDLRPWLTSQIFTDDGLDDILNKIFAQAANNPSHQAYWRDYSTVERILPFKNTFLTMRNAALLDKARVDLSKAARMANDSMAHWYGVSEKYATTRFTDEAKSERQWSRDAWAEAQAALDGDGIFRFPKKLPKGGDMWIEEASGDYYAISVSEFFKPSAFTLANLFVTELGGKVPSLFKIIWYEDKNDGYKEVVTGEIELVSQPIEGLGGDKNMAGNNSAPYGRFSFMVNTDNLKKIFPMGFSEFKDTEVLSTVFPHIPLWPSKPTYFIGTNSTAGNLYKYYHQR